MKHAYEVIPVHVAGSLCASGGTITTTGIDWSPTYEPEVKLAVTVHTLAAGALVATLEQSNVVGSGYVTLATLSPGTVAGLYSADATSTQRYLRMVATATGGTTPLTATLIGKPRQPG